MKKFNSKQLSLISSIIMGLIIIIIPSLIFSISNLSKNNLKEKNKTEESKTKKKEKHDNFEPTLSDDFEKVYILYNNDDKEYYVSTSKDDLDIESNELIKEYECHENCQYDGVNRNKFFVIDGTLYYHNEDELSQIDIDYNKSSRSIKNPISNKTYNVYEYVFDYDVVIEIVSDDKNKYIYSYNRNYRSCNNNSFLTYTFDNIKLYASDYLSCRFYDDYVIKDQNQFVRVYGGTALYFPESLELNEDINIDSIQKDGSIRIKITFYNEKTNKYKTYKFNVNNEIVE